LLLWLLAATASSCIRPMTARQVVLFVDQRLDTVQDWEAVVRVRSAATAPEDELVVRQWWSRPGRYRCQYLHPQEVAGQVTVYDGETLWHYDPGTGRVVYFAPHQVPRGPQGEVAFPQWLLRRLQEGRVELRGTDRVEEYDCYLLECRWDQELYRVWVDRASWFPVRWECFDEEGILLFAVTVTQLEYNLELEGRLFVPEFPAATEVVEGGLGFRQVELHQVREWVGFEPRLPAFLPPGVEMTGVYVMGEGEDLAVVINYQGPWLSFSLTESRRKPGPLPEGLRTVDYRGRTYRVIESEGATVLSWVGGELEFALLGDGGLQELLRIAASVP